MMLLLLYVGITSFVVGFALQKSGAVDPKTLLAQMQGRDMTIVKVFIGMAVPSIVLIAILQQLGLVTINHNHFHPIASAVGGLLVGAGLMIATIGVAREKEFQIGWAGAGIFVGILLGVKIAMSKFNISFPDLPQRLFTHVGEVGLFDAVGVSYGILAVCVALTLLLILWWLIRKL